MDDVQVRNNLIVEASMITIEDREVKQLWGKEIALVNVDWGEPTWGSIMWKMESRMKECYPDLILIGNFRGQNLLSGEEL